ncbi:hypothetical protein HBI56_153930 [Parastagonospora nodorum]|nr:hypothetical protein HBH56_116590 [Parastagonospora nodorum]KAH3928785.1 hypothetical protein HBH54_132590 [Parastagonospora nodorum]KAH3950503.1 hypothetical protein HBH53_072850 [Parastagonospora nodorum]KAH3965792.1 hypothetical protein HBH51_148890 [Parastagonospora nodorum]KAH3973779.1 hypothetical protein HBH52_138920 [Parastagonospora nodorum]
MLKRWHNSPNWASTSVFVPGQGPRPSSRATCLFYISIQHCRFSTNLESCLLDTWTLDCVFLASQRPLIYPTHRASQTPSQKLLKISRISHANRLICVSIVLGSASFAAHGHIFGHHPL